MKRSITQPARPNSRSSLAAGGSTAIRKLIPSHIAPLESRRKKKGTEGRLNRPRSLCRVTVGCRSGSLTRGHVGVVQRVPVGYGAADCSRRRLDRRRASVHSLVDSSKDAPVSGIVLQGKDATLDERRSNAGEG